MKYLVVFITVLLSGTFLLSERLPKKTGLLAQLVERRMLTH